MYSISVENISCGTSIYANCLRESEDEIFRHPLFPILYYSLLGLGTFCKNKFSIADRNFIRTLYRQKRLNNS